jgi:hypothetical protein
MTAPVVGIDIAKADFVVALRPTGEAWTAPNDEPGVHTTVERLRRLAPALVVLEATGGYETALAVALARAGLPVVVANPRQVRDFAKATGQLAKTDRLDAHLLALFAERVRAEPRPLPDAARRQLDALVTRRRQLLEMLTAEKNRLAHAQPPIRADITRRCSNAKLGPRRSFRQDFKPVDHKNWLLACGANVHDVQPQPGACRRFSRKRLDQGVLQREPVRLLAGPDLDLVREHCRVLRGMAHGLHPAAQQLLPPRLEGAMLPRVLGLDGILGVGRVDRIGRAVNDGGLGPRLCDGRPLVRGPVGRLRGCGEAQDQDAEEYS